MKTGNEIVDFLGNADDEKYLLMKRVIPHTRKNVCITAEAIAADNVIVSEITQELGIFGIILIDNSSGKAVLEDTAGYIVRSKNADAVYGSFAKASAALDTIYFK